MTKYNFIKVILIISAMLLLFAQSAYDPAVQARMRTLEDDELAQIDGEAIWLTFDITVRSVANELYMIDKTNNSAFGFYDGVVLGDGLNTTASSNFKIDSTLAWDVGTQGAQTWLLGGNFSFPSSAGIGLIANSLNVTTIGNTAFRLGSNVQIAGFYFGRNVTSATPQLLPGDTPWILISAKMGQGIEFRSKETAYLDQIKYAYNTTTALQVSGIYVYGLTNTVAGTSSAGWAPAQGQFILGGELPNVDTGGAWTGTNVTVLTGADVGYNGGGANQTRPRLSMPMAGTVRIRNFTLPSNGNPGFGPIALDDVVMFRQIFTFRPNL